MSEASAYTRLLAFDFGTKRMGVATGQSITATAAPLAPVPARDGIPDWDRLDQAFKEWQPEAVIVGLPLNMDGTESELSHLARKFARRLHARYRLPVFMQDERLTSRAARAELEDAFSRRKGKLPSLDSTAAVLILEAWLNTPTTIRP